ncbi:MAG TPA: polyprenyl diphosphate synthase [Candidatus Woesebacteria bacterium]|nr:polyprenyl diphosphate synthase [Candidatus Woesebacteria bacterium]
MKSPTPQLPKHIAIIMDGNRRWARKNKLEIFKGHQKVAEEGIERLVDHCLNRGISYLTLWAFSTENWKRDRAEVEAILQLMRSLFVKGAGKLTEKKIKIATIGDLSRFPWDIQESIKKLKESCRTDYQLTVTFALNYGGRDEIARAVSKLLDQLAAANQTGQSHALLNTTQIEQSLSGFLDTSFLPDPDLIIRTGGEQRLSGFMPWQSVYAELYFTNVLMPDFDETQLDQAIDDYLNRERRFGK